MLKGILEKQGFNQEQINGVLNAMAEAKLFVSDTEDATSRVMALTNDKASLEAQLQEVNKTIKALKKSNEDNEELQDKIKKHEATIKQMEADNEAKVRDLTLDRDINAMLTANKAKYPDLLASKIDKKALNIVDGKTVGLEAQLEALKGSYAEMFDSESLKDATYTYTPNAGTSTSESGSIGTSELLSIVQAEQVKR